MKKRYGNMITKTGKKNGFAVWICAIILTGCLETLAGCSITKSMEEVTEQVAAEDSGTKDMQAENIRTDEAIPESGIRSSETEQFIRDDSVFIGNLTVALYEEKQDITARLKESGMNYNEYDSDMKYQDSSYNQYDSYYMIGESPLGTDASRWVDASLCVYFKEGICVRLSLLKEEARTARGIHKDNSYVQLMEQYGDFFEKTTYAAHGRYDVYRYSYDDFICEFAILEDHPDSIQSVDIYVSSLSPFCEYGEEL